MTETPERWPDLVLVNGPSSAGKTTLCRALQAAIPSPYLVVGFDDFILMSAPRYYRGADTGRRKAAGNVNEGGGNFAQEKALPRTAREG